MVIIFIPLRMVLGTRVGELGLKNLIDLYAHIDNIISDMTPKVFCLVRIFFAHLRGFIGG